MTSTTRQVYSIAAGNYLDVSGNTQGFVTSATDGGWQTAQSIVLPSDAIPINYIGSINPPPYQILGSSVSALGKGSVCGFYPSETYGINGFITYETTDGSWTTLAANQYASVVTAVSNQVASGFWRDSTTGQLYGLFGSQATDSGGNWSFLASRMVNAFFTTVSSCNPGNGLIGGGIHNTLTGSGVYSAFVQEQTQGVWDVTHGQTILPFYENQQYSYIVSLSQSSIGNAIGGGVAFDDSFSFSSPFVARPFLTTQVNGVWSPAYVIPFDYDNTQPIVFAQITSVAASSDGNAVAGGFVSYGTTGAFQSYGFVLNQVHGVWDSSIRVLLPTNGNTADITVNSAITSVSSPSDGNALAYGYYVTAEGTYQTVAFQQTQGAWNPNPTLLFPPVSGYISTATNPFVGYYFAAASSSISWLNFTNQVVNVTNGKGIAGGSFDSSSSEVLVSDGAFALPSDASLDSVVQNAFVATVSAILTQLGPI